MSFLESLKKTMPPPADPSDRPFGGGWQFVERSLGVELPEDYKEFVATYGTGAVDNFLWVLNPFAKNKNLNLNDQATTRLDAQRRFHAESGIEPPFAFHPDPDGIFPWGITDNGDVLYWLCKGSPSSWNIVICDSRSFRWRTFDLILVHFLTSVLTKRLIVDVFPDDFPSDQPRFMPAQ
jgi:SMI1-KNR4 cell-wall